MSGGEGQEDDANSDKRSWTSTPVAETDKKSSEEGVFFSDWTPSFCKFNTFLRS